MHHALKTATLVIATLTGIALMPDALGAQKHCNKGILCGGTCISASKTCHIGTSSARTQTPQPETARQTAAPMVRPSQPRARANSASSAQWLGSSRGHTYYRAECAGASKLARANLIYFKSEAEARHARYVHSVQKGC